MVARIVSGKSIRGILNYNENKLRNAEAKVLLAAGFPRSPDELSFKDKLERFEKLIARNERTKTNTLHITLNFSRQDKVDDDLLRLLAIEYMEAIGFGAQPFLVYRHFDAAHPHIHLATVNIDADGNRIETHNIGKIQSEKARRELEDRYGLVKAEQQNREVVFQLGKVDLERAVYGKRETKAAISTIVREVVGTYKFCSLPELNAALRQFGVLADPGAEGSVMRNKGGLVYSLLDENGDRVGIPIKASSIYSSPTLKSLEQKFPINKEERKPYVLRLKHLLDKSLRNSKTELQFQKLLSDQGIRILIRENAQGQVYGITFIDNATRVVANGSTIGKEYGAKAFMEKLNALQDFGGHAASLSSEAGFETGKRFGQDKPSQPAMGLPTIERIIDFTTGNGHDQGAGGVRERKEKKKGLQQ